MATAPSTKTNTKKASTSWHQSSATRWIIALFVAVIAVVTIGVGTYVGYFNDAALTGVRIAGEDVSGKSRAHIEERLKERIEEYTQTNWPVRFAVQEQEWIIPEETISWEVTATVLEAMALGRRGNLSEQIRQRWDLWRQPVDLPIKIQFSEQLMASMSASMAAVLSIEAIPPSLQVEPSASGSSIVYAPGSDGRQFNKELFWQQLVSRHSRLEPIDQEIPVDVIGMGVDAEDQFEAIARAEDYLGKELVLLYEDQGEMTEWKVDEETLVSWLDFNQPFNYSLIDGYLDEVALAIDRPAQDAKFSFNQTTAKVEEFVPAKPGLSLERKATSGLITQALTQLEILDVVEPVSLEVVTTEPEVSMAEVNNLGIQELLGKGESTYVGSIASRVHNVALAASRITGTLVKPGEEFSYNQALGEVSAATGFQAAYVIMNGRTELGDGGGVCQDSTTVFRAALDAGLPITERRGHSYRVGYYEQNAKPGLDATVYAPSTDFRFLNDTPAHLLIQATADNAQKRLVVEIYGTHDGRTSEITNHVVWDITPPLPDEYIDDPTLPAGKVTQIDWKSGGAKARFDYRVTRAEEVLWEKTFTTVYKPWSAKFLRGTGS